MDQFKDYLITNRTEADAARARYLASLWGLAPGQWRGTAEERAEWDAGLKGAYNAADLNRVTLAASYVLTKLGEMGYAIPDTFPTYLASATVDPPGSGTAQGALFYKGDQVTVSAAPIGESRFLHWSKNGETVSESPVYTFSGADANLALTAHFEAEWVMETSIVGAGRIGKAILGRGL